MADDGPRLNSSIKEEIIRLTREFRVTVIHGETGCGKSTLVPQLLLDEGMEGRRDTRRILCSQPRRLATVAVAERVASLRGTTLGGEVGFAIGQRIVASKQTRLLFCTAGTLLEKIRSRGENALRNVRYIVVDEVHERSSENDLLLASLKQMLVFASGGRRRGGGGEGDEHMRRVNLVIMSATFDVDRYRRYFAAIPDAGARCVTLQTFRPPRPPSAGGGGGGGGLLASLADRQARTAITDNYLEQATRFLATADPDVGPAVLVERQNLLRRHPRTTSTAASADGGEGPGGQGGPFVSQPLLRFAADLVVAQARELLHTERADRRPPRSLGILVFLPTFRQIEQLAECLGASRRAFTARLLARFARRRARLRRRHRRQTSSYGDQDADDDDDDDDDIAAEEAMANAEVLSTLDDDDDDGDNDNADADDEEVAAEGAEEAERERRDAAESAKFEVTVLHSSLDVEDLTSTLEGLGSRQRGRRKRRVFLATTIAESSITIPDVAVVIDLARTNRVFWDPSRRNTFAQIEWASRDSCLQRRGRTGRTCPGSFFQLVPASFAQTQLPEFEPPYLLRCSLREEALTSLCSASRATCTPASLLAACLDPPNPERLSDALDALLTVRAARLTVASSSSSSSSSSIGNLAAPGTVEVTALGRLLDSLPVSLEAARFAVTAARHGFLREGAVLASLMSTTPLPIEAPFREPAAFNARLRRFGGTGAGGAADAASGASVQLSNHPDAVLEAQLGAVIAHFQWAAAARATSAAAVATASDRMHRANELTCGGCGGFTDDGSDGRARADQGAAAGERRGGGPIALRLLDEDDWMNDDGASTGGGGGGGGDGGGVAGDDSSDDDVLRREDVFCGRSCLVRSALAAVNETAAVIEAALTNDLHNRQATVVLNAAIFAATEEAVGSASSGGGGGGGVGGIGGGAVGSAAASCGGLVLGWLQGGAGSCHPSDVLGPTRTALLRRLLRERHASVDPSPLHPSRAAAAAAGGRGERGYNGGGGGGGARGRGVCVYFQRGHCSRGASCRFDHISPGGGGGGGDGLSLAPLCQFFASAQGCRFGAGCNYRHALAAPTTAPRRVDRPPRVPPPSSTSPSGRGPRPLPLPPPPPFSGNTSAVAPAAATTTTASGASGATGGAASATTSAATGAADAPSSSSSSSSSSSLVLVLGDGDLGYAACVARELGSRLLATTLETSAGCLRTYGDARRHANAVTAAGGRLAFSVDALRLCDAASPLQAALAQLQSTTHRRQVIGTVVMNFPVFLAPSSASTAAAKSGASGGVDGGAGAVLEDEGELDWDAVMDTNPQESNTNATGSSASSNRSTGDEDEDEEAAAASDARRQQVGVAQLFKEVLGLVARGAAAADVSLRLRLSHDQLSRWRVLDGARRSYWDVTSAIVEREVDDEAEWERHVSRAANGGGGDQFGPVWDAAAAAAVDGVSLRTRTGSGGDDDDDDDNDNDNGDSGGSGENERRNTVLPMPYIPVKGYEDRALRPRRPRLYTFRLLLAPPPSRPPLPRSPLPDLSSLAALRALSPRAPRPLLFAMLRAGWGMARRELVDFLRRVQADAAAGGGAGGGGGDNARRGAANGGSGGGGGGDGGGVASSSSSLRAAIARGAALVGDGGGGNGGGGESGAYSGRPPSLEVLRAAAVDVIRAVANAAADPCPICLEPVADPVRAWECPHELCRSCLGAMDEHRSAASTGGAFGGGSGATCPLCRARRVPI